MWHQLPYELKHLPGHTSAFTAGSTPPPSSVRIPSGRATLGARAGEIPFGWDNEFPGVVVVVAAFSIDVHDVTNEQYLDFVEAGCYRQAEWWTPEAFAWIRGEGVEHPRFWRGQHGSWTWRGMFNEIDLPAAWPVYVSQAEAAAYARWKGARLPTEAEYHRAAFGEPSGSERLYPWGHEPPDRSKGIFDFASWHPIAAGICPAGQSAWGVQDLMGNGWEWTSTVFAPFDGFRPMASYPEYSADFFDGHHVVMKGASPATARELLRRSFRNWFRPTYPYVYATFRCARSIE
jgi:formylglycine-generating enzyme required for sulfatase activity